MFQRKSNATFSDINKKGYKRLITLKSKGAIITEKVIKKKALKFAERSNFNFFEATNGWIHE
jgi:hypothetical protein